MASGVLVGRGYVSIRPEFDGNWSRAINSRAGAAGSQFAAGFGKALSRGLKTTAALASTALAGNLAGAAGAAGSMAPALLAAASAGGALKVGLLGVGDAMKAAFDPEKAEEFNKAMAKLSPNARAFVGQLRSMKPALDSVKKSVQDALFEKMDSTIKSAATVTLPIFKKSLTDSASAMNLMGRNVVNTVTGLGQSGALGQALSSANAGLRNLATVPGTVVQGFTQLAAAAGPSFASLTAAAGGAMDRLSDRMTQSFASGQMQSFVEGAFGVLSQLGSILGDAFATVGNVLGAAAEAGGQVLGVLGSVFAELARVTAMPGVQAALQAVFGAVAQIAGAIGPVIGAVVQAVMPLLGAVAPVIGQLAAALGPVLTQLATQLGTALTPIIAGLLPVVKLVGNALIQVISAITPLLAPIGKLIGAVISALLPVLRPIIGIVVQLVKTLIGPLMTVVKAIVPLVRMFGSILGQVFGALRPLIGPIVGIVGTLLGVFARLAALIIGQVMAAIRPLIPVFVQIVTLIVRLAVQVISALMPSLTQLIGAGMKLLMAVLPILPVVAKLAGLLVGLAVKVLAVVLPPIIRFASFLIGVVVKVLATVIGWVAKLIGWVVKKLSPAFTWLWTKAKAVFNGIKLVISVWWKVTKILFQAAWSWIKGKLGPVFTWLKDRAVKAWTLIKLGITGVWNKHIRPAFNAVKSAVGKVGVAFARAKDAIKKAWDKVKSIAKAPIAFVINTVYNKGIVGVWNKVAKAFGAPMLKGFHPKGFATGGYTGDGGKYEPKGIVHGGEFVTNKASTSKMERTHPGVLGYINRTGSLPGYAKGGLVDKSWSWIKNAASSGWDKVKQGAKWLRDTIKGSAMAGLNGIVKPLIAKITGSASTYKSMITRVPKKMLTSIFDWSGKADKKLEAAGVVVGGGGFKKGQRWAKTQHGKRYQWGGNGNPSWDCLTLSSVITTPEGFKALRDIHPGDSVLAFQDGKIVSSRVLAKWNTGEKDLFKVRTRNRSIRATAGHRVLVAAPVERAMTDPDERVAMAEWGTQWKHIRDLTTSDYLVTYTGSRKDGGQEVPTDLAWLMGLWLADGSVNAGGGIRICVYDDLAEKAMAVLRKHTPDRQVTHHPRHGVMVSDVRRARWMVRNGFCGKSHERSVPAVVMDWSYEAQVAFLNGYADGDGSYKGGGDFDTAELITYKATSRELIEGVRELHLRQGDRVTCTRTEQRTKDIYIGGKKIKNARPIHNIDVARGKGAEQTTGAGHRPGLLRLVEQLKLENMSVQKVLSIEPDGAEETWDIEVEDSHSFVSDGLVSHNCSGYMSAIESVIRGQRPHRRWATGAFGRSGPAGWRRNARSPFMIGITNAGVGHTAGTINGVNVESRGGDGVIYGRRARGYRAGMFTSRWGFVGGKKYDAGGWLQPGVTTAVNGTGQPEAILTAQQWRTMQAAAAGGDGASGAGPFEVSGDLYLDSGEFMGKVRGVVRSENQRLTGRFRAGR